MERKIMVLVNPNAGKSGYRGELGNVLRVFCDGGWIPTVFFTRKKGEAPGLVRNKAGEYEAVICLGGDGTLSEVSAGMMLAPQRRPIGYIPLGTSNDVAHTLGLSAVPAEAAERIIQGRPIPYDIGRFGAESFFTYIAAFGAFTEVSYATPQESKQALGHLAYMLEGLRQLPKISEYPARIEYDGGTLEGEFIFGAVTNSTSVAGLVKLDGDSVDLADGKFEVLLVRKPQDLLDLGDIISAVMAMDFSGPAVSFLRTRQIRFVFQTPVSWTRDGEEGGVHREVFISNCHPGVEIIV